MNTAEVPSGLGNPTSAPSSENLSFSNPTQERPSLTIVDGRRVDEVGVVLPITGDTIFMASSLVGNDGMGQPVITLDSQRKLTKAEKKTAKKARTAARLTAQQEVTFQEETQPDTEQPLPMPWVDRRPITVHNPSRSVKRGAIKAAGIGLAAGTLLGAAQIGQSQTPAEASYGPQAITRPKDIARGEPRIPINGLPVADIHASERVTMTEAMAEEAVEQAYGPSLVTAAELARNPQDITQVVRVTNGGEITAEYGMHRTKKKLYKHKLNPATNAFEAFKATSADQIPLSLLTTFGVNNAIVVGGIPLVTDSLGSSPVGLGLVTSYDDGKTWQKKIFEGINAPSKIIPFPGKDNVFIVMAVSHTDTNTCYLLNVEDPQNQTLTPLPIDGGKAKVSAGSLDEDGIFRFYTLGAGPSGDAYGYDVNEIDARDPREPKVKTTRKHEELGILNGGITSFKGPNGVDYVLVGSQTTQKLHLIDGNGTVTTESYANWLDDHNIPGYLKGSLTLTSHNAIFTDKFTVELWLGGSVNYADGRSKAVVVHRQLGNTQPNKEAVTFYIPEPEYDSGIGTQDSVGIHFVNRVPVVSQLVRPLGLVVRTIGFDGRPAQNSVEVYPNKGLGSDATPEPSVSPTPSPTPSPIPEQPPVTPTPTPKQGGFQVFLTHLARAARSEW